jgi:oligoendopeptidase F
MAEQRVRLSERLLDLGYERDDLAVVLRKFRNQKAIYRPENVPLIQELQPLDARYQRITGEMTAEWEGKTVALAQLKPYLQNPDRTVRERAFRLMLGPYIEQRDALADVFDEQYALRQRIAENAGFADFRDFMFQEKNRFDYTPADCEAFHDAVAETVVPALAKRYERRRGLLGVETLRPWDTGADPLGRPALKPYEQIDELVTGTEQMLGRVDPVFGAYLATMRQEGLLDLESRPGKAPGGYCTGFEFSKRPFIFMNASGTQDDVETMLHEGGHAIHAFETMERLPLTFQRYPGEEMAEVGSMAMELLAAPYLAREEGGFYSVEDAARARTEHLEGVLSALAWIAAIDAFQHWIYASGDGHDRDARDAAWQRIADRFDGGLDWSGAEAEGLARWYRQLHIFLVPFYYIEYGIAQLGALQVWRNSLRDQAGAIAAYRQALALGNTRSLPELYEAAGARFAFDRETIGELVEMIEATLAEMDAQA